MFNFLRKYKESNEDKDLSVRLVEFSEYNPAILELIESIKKESEIKIREFSFIW